MPQFDYNRNLAQLMMPNISSALASLHEHKGREDLYARIAPETLDQLYRVARIQSTSASNRIENISTSDARLRKIVEQAIEPENRDEREIAGYRFVLDEIHRSYKDIPVTPGVILQLHRDLYRYQDASFAGRWKDSDNQIVETLSDGTRFVRFQPTSAAATPGAVQAICDQYAEQMRCGAYDPLLVAFVFAFDFVSIHPFTDGNGRMSRLITLLLTYKCGFSVGKYISIEAEIERTKETYYEALRASSTGWSEGANDFVPFVSYMLGVLESCYKALDARCKLFEPSNSNEDVLRAYFGRITGKVTKRQILEDNPVMSQRTVERILQKLQAEGYIEKTGAARATAYRRKE